MATKTLGTKATTSLTAIQWQPGGLSAADLATINELIRTPGNNASVANSCRIENGVLYVPGRFDAPIQLVAGDWIAVDALGWPIIIPALAMTPGNSSWTHS